MIQRKTLTTEAVATLNSIVRAEQETCLLQAHLALGDVQFSSTREMTAAACERMIRHSLQVLQVTQGLREEHPFISALIGEANKEAHALCVDLFARYERMMRNVSMATEIAANLRRN
jgi:hypothetical protein